MKTVKTTLLMISLAWLFSACSNQQATSKKYFRITAPQFNAQDDSKPLTLVIKRPQALSILGGRPMVATQDDGSLVQLSHHFWLDSPKILFQDILSSWAAQHWQTISSQVPSDQGYQILESRILAFEKKQNQAKVKIEFKLFNEDNQLLFTQVFERFQPLNGEGYRAYSDAISLAIGHVLNSLEQGL